ncbi:glutaredoxin domain-containing protein, partial [Solidesulfovibrio sp.]|uniref:glutaredoxin family protein n=1 Tax=Solidesulfovibrio sp. TaxID=2910990 RepID=UPI0026286DFD
MPAKFLPTALVLTMALLAALLAPQAPALAGAPKVENFVTSWCPYCTKTKAYFDSKGIAYTAFDIE